MRAATLAALAAVGCSPAVVEPRAPSPPPDPATSEAVGAGYLVTGPVAGEAPANDRGVPVAPKVTADFTGMPTTNDWWSSLIWQFDRGGKANPYSEPMFAHPLAMQAERHGLAIAYPAEVTADAGGYRHAFVPDLLVGADGLDSPDARVARYSDWTVTASWADSDGDVGPLRATFGHGLPFVYVETTGGRAARLEARADVEVWHLEGEVVGLTVRGHHYAAFAPAGARWTRDGRSLQAALPELDDGYAVAVLPDRTPATLARFRAHAYTFVTGGQVSWEYAARRGQVVTHFDFATARRPTSKKKTPPLVALYRHQWLHTDAPLDKLEYRSARGAMKLAAVGRFDTRLPFRGVMPFLPVIDGGARGDIYEQVDDAWRRGDFVPPGMDGKKDSYWSGKAVQRLAVLIHLADQVGHARARADLLRALENELEDWFDGRAPFLVRYDSTWRTAIGVPSAYFSAQQLNDHHFHYGYFIFAAATAAHFDPAWAARDRWGAMVEVLIRDVAAWKRDDPKFPFLRNFDAYAGHSWANGPALFATGNNQESSSEDVNFAVGAILWGAATGDDGIRDLGVFLHANLTAAIDQYWFDVDDAVFPAGFARPTIAILWGDGGRYETWWDPSPVYVHGINFLPFTGGSLYLGHRPAYTAANWKGLVEANRGEPLQWRDILWMYLAVGDPEAAASRWAAEHRFTPEFGNSPAATGAWIAALRSAGGPDPSVTADVPTALVLRKGGDRTYLAFNPGPAPLTVRFSDGRSLTAPPRAYAHARHPVPGVDR